MHEGIRKEELRLGAREAPSVHARACAVLTQMCSYWYDRHVSFISDYTLVVLCSKLWHRWRQEDARTFGRKPSKYSSPRCGKTGLTAVPPWDYPLQRKKLPPMGWHRGQFSVTSRPRSFSFGPWLWWAARCTDEIFIFRGYLLRLGRRGGGAGGKGGKELV